MKISALGLWVFVVGLLSVGFSELTLVTWLNHAPMEVTNHLFWLAILPTTWVAAGIVSAAF